MRIREIPKHERPREKLASHGPASLTDSELLAIFLRTGVPGKSAVAVAADLLKSKGSLGSLSRCDAEELRRSGAGIGPAKACELAAAFELAKRLARGAEERPLMDSAESLYRAFSADFQSLSTEVLTVALLDTKLRLLRFQEIARGSLNECIAHPREIFRAAIIHHAYAVIVIHNHPSGDPAPSQADHRLTRQLRDAASFLQINMLDHVIMGSADGGRRPYFSFREAGAL